MCSTLIYNSFKSWKACQINSSIIQEFMQLMDIYAYSTPENKAEHFSTFFMKLSMKYAANYSMFFMFFRPIIINLNQGR